MASISEIVERAASADAAAEPVETPEPAAEPAPETSEAPAAEPVEGEKEPPSPPNEADKGPGVSSKFAELLSAETEKRTTEQEEKLVPQLQEQIANLKTLARTNPLAFLQEQGVDPQSLAPYFQQPQQHDPLEEQARRLEAVEAQIREREIQEREARRQAQLEAAKTSVKEWISSSEEFPLTKASPTGADLVFSTMLTKYQKEGVAMSERDAARAVEDQIRQLVEILAPAAGYQRQSTPEPAPTQQAFSRTLSNAHSGSSGPPRPGLTNEERLAEILAKYEG